MCFKIIISWLNADRIINILALIITAFIGILALKIAIQSEKESVTNTQFKALVDKTDNVMIASQNQLKLNEEAKLSIDKGDKNRFIAAVFRLGAKIGMRNNMKDGYEETEVVTKYVNDLIPIFESQMNNPFLCRNDTMLRLWINAYIHLNIVGHEGSYSSAFSNEFDIRTPSRIDDLLPPGIQIKRNFLSVWDAVNEAYVYCGKKIKRESSNFVIR